MIMEYRCNQAVEHDFFGIGQLIGYNSSSGKYLVDFGQDKPFTRWCEPDTLFEHKAIEKNGQMSLEAFV